MASEANCTTKKRFWLLLLLAFFLSISSSAVHANEGTEEIRVYLNKGVSIALRGKEWQPVDQHGNRLYPITYEDRIYVPFRELEEGVFRYVVDWDAQSRTITVDRRAVDMEFHRLTRIAEHEIDLTGDQRPDVLHAYAYTRFPGSPYDEGYMMLIGQSEAEKQRMVHIPGRGFRSELRIEDINDNGVVDIVFHSVKDDRGSMSREFHILYDGEFVEVPGEMVTSQARGSTVPDEKSNLETVTAYKNKSLNIIIRGEEWIPVDEKGNRLYPITYEGRTYVPLRALEEEFFDELVVWNAHENTVITYQKDIGAGIYDWEEILVEEIPPVRDGQTESARLYRYTLVSTANPYFDTGGYMLLVGGQQADAQWLVYFPKGSFSERPQMTVEGSDQGGDVTIVVHVLAEAGGDETTKKLRLVYDGETLRLAEEEMAG